MNAYVYTMQGNSGKSSLARTTFKNKAIGVWARSTKALIIELWAKVSLSAQGVIPLARCFPPADALPPLEGCCPQHRGHQQEHAKSLSPAQSLVILLKGLMKVGLNRNSRVRTGAKVLLLLLSLRG